MRIEYLLIRNFKSIRELEINDVEDVLILVGRMCNEWKETKEMLQYIDVIVDGKFEEDKKDMMLQFKGSSNQRTILVKESLESGNIVLLYD